MLSATHFRISRVRLLHLLDELKSNSIEAASVCIPPQTSQADVEGMIATLVDRSTIPRELSKTMADSPTGAVLFWSPHHRYIVMPPFPIEDKFASNTCIIEPLRKLLEKEILFGLVIVRLGAFAVGVIKGQEILTSKAGTGLVHSRHRQGGSSSHRFERHREKQMESFFTRVCEHIREQLEPYARSLEYIIYGGTRETILDFQKQCHYLRQFKAREVNILINIREPKKSGLEEAVKEAWSSRIIQMNQNIT